MNEQPFEGMLTLQEVCRFFGGDGKPLNQATIYRWVQTGKLAPPVRFGRTLQRWKRSDCQKTIDNMMHPANGKQP
jgi:predicted DNA-binding transcriptional regulator AlpA